MALSVCVLAAACGQKAGSMPPDADLRGPVQIHLVGFNAINIFDAVVFIDPDGTVVGDMMPDANGNAAAIVSPGANVSIVTHHDHVHDVSTILAIEPGDDLTIDETEHPFTQGNVEVDLTALDGATMYAVNTCQATNATPGANMIAGCASSPYDVYGIAYDATGPVATVRVQGVTTDTTKVTLPTSWDPLTSTTIALSNVPADILDVTVNHGCELAEPAAVGASTWVYLDAPPWSGSLEVPASCSPVRAIAAAVNRRTEASMLSQELTYYVADTAITDPIDIGGRLLPWLLGVDFDPTTATLTAMTDSNGATTSPDVVEYLFSYDVGTESVDWYIYSPTTDPVSLPTLPADAGPISPINPSRVVSADAFMVESSRLMGWNQVRPQVVSFVMQAGEFYSFGDAPGDSLTWQSTPPRP
jgi:hypothetical protein